MELSNQFKDLIVKEINFAVKNIDNSDDPLEKLYYFSAIHGVINRVLNIEYHSDLVVAFIILQTTSETLKMTFQGLRQGDTSPLRITDVHFNKLSSLSKKLSTRIKKDEDFTDILNEFVILTYSTTGNGHYLMKKGFLKI